MRMKVSTSAKHLMFLIIGMVLSVSANATLLTIDYEVNIDTFYEFSTHSVTAYASPIRHGSVDVFLDPSSSHLISTPVMPSGFAVATRTEYSTPSIFHSPIPDLIDSSYYLGNNPYVYNQTVADRAHDRTISAFNNFSVYISSQTGPLRSTNYSQSLNLHNSFGQDVTPGPDPFAVSDSMLISYLENARETGITLGFYEGFIDYGQLQIGSVSNTTGKGWSGIARITELSTDGVSVRPTVPEPGTILLFALGLIAVFATKRSGSLKLGLARRKFTDRK